MRPIPYPGIFAAGLAVAVASDAFAQSNLPLPSGNGGLLRASEAPEIPDLRGSTPGQPSALFSRAEDGVLADAGGDAVCDGDSLDSDADGVPDCVDTCPFDPNVVNTNSGAVYATLTDAIADASQGDTLELGPCVFNEAGFTLFNRDLTIRGRGMGETIIDGQGQPRLFRMTNGDSTTVEGMTLRNTRPIGSGGGVLFTEASEPTLRRVAMEGHDGTGRATTLILGEAAARVTIDSCRISDNIADEFGSMILFLESVAPSVVVNTVFSNNLGGERGRVVRFVRGPGGDVVNCTFAGNTAAAAVTGEATSPHVANSVSDAPMVGGSVTVTNSVFPGATGNNIDTTPAFTDATNGDYTLLEGSPGIDFADAAEYVDAGGPAVDVVGNPRISDDLSAPNASISPIDAGAFEFQAPERCAAADLARPIGVLDLDDVDAFIAGFTAGDAIADLADPVGVLDLDDIDGFITSFQGGCP